MASIEDAIKRSGVTPFRKTHVTFDVPDISILEAPFTRHVEKDQFKIQSSAGITRLASGAIALKPLNEDFSTRETTDGQQYAIRLSDWIAEQKVVEVAQQRVYSELVGVSPDPSVASSGDYYMTKRVPSGSSWTSLFLSSDDKIPYPTPHYPIDRILEGPGNDIEKARTGYLLKFAAQGSMFDHTDILLSFYFGGQITPNGYGRFAVSFSGDGMATLWEFYGGAFQIVATWRYALAGLVPGHFHHVKILPHPPSYIEFDSGSLKVGPAITGFNGEPAMGAVQARQYDQLQSYLHVVSNRGTLTGSDGSLLPVTGAGRLAVDVRRDNRMFWQIQRLAYPASGSFSEYGFTVPHQVGDTHLLSVSPLGYNYSENGTVLTGASFSVRNPDTAVALATGSETYAFNGQTASRSGWKLPGDVNKCQLVATLTTSESAPRYHTPVLYGYEANRLCHTAAVSNGEKTGGRIRLVSISGPDVQPDHETAHLRISDLKDELSVLRTRSNIPVRIETEYDPADASKRSVLFEGYVGKAEAVKRIALPTDYPSKEWRDYELACVGRWHRLEGRFFNNLKSFADDSTSPFGGPLLKRPWKVVDAIRWTLLQQGWNDDQLDIFDDPIRFSYNPTVSALDGTTAFVGTSVQQWLRAVLSDYLNAFLVWDGNAQAAGQWRLIRPPTASSPILWNFVTTVQNPGKLPHQSASYGANTSPVLGRPFQFRSTVIPPEGNTLMVTGGAQILPGGVTGKRAAAYFENRASWNAPRFSAGDLNSLDWLGYVRPLHYIDQTITDQATACFIGRRMFNLACKGRKYVTFTSELVLATPNETLANGSGPVYTTRTRRPLRVGDMVHLDGVAHMVHNCNPMWVRDHLMLAEYELELFRSDLTWS